ncbi:hypothetical protein [Mobilicoccus sp.]|uniref:hypothetical protein n=1 Tax=Mobilicoccus sp. TaxID=2034349 RepID=UPI0028B243B7|nr:hypothetical protein [Mobilicoccus sp.]
MSTTVYGVLDELREMATSERDKGSMLERLLLQYLRSDPLWAEQFDDVWLWNDWPDWIAPGRVEGLISPGGWRHACTKEASR